MIAWPRAFAFAHPGIVSASRRGSEIRTLVGQDRLGSLDGPLREIVAAVDGHGFHCCALRSLRTVWAVLATIELCELYCGTRHKISPRLRVQVASSKPLRFARSRRFLTDEGAHFVPPRGVRS